MGRCRLTRAEKQTLEDNASHLSSIRDELYEAQDQVSATITALMSEMAVPGALQEDCFQEAWVAHLQNKPIQTSIERFMRVEREYNEKFNG